MTGYLHHLYAESLMEYGIPRALPRCKGWILDRQICGFPYSDAIGCYPLFTCQNWSQLYYDLEDIGDDLVSLALVTDPFGEYDENYLRECFEDVVVPFKAHFVVDCCLSINEIVSKHHNYYARRALKNISIEKSDNPIQFIDDWVKLYACLIKKHNLRGIKAFSKRSFEKQLTTPGIVMFRAISQDTTVGAHLWYEHGDIAYSHLAAFNSLGYKQMASYAIYWTALKYLSDRVRWVDLGAGAGLSSDRTDGLSQFKKGWATGTRTAYFCGKIFDRKKYMEISKARNITKTDYFPSYRYGEFL